MYVIIQTDDRRYRMNEIITNEELNIEDMIYEIRGKHVMLDSDLGMLYKCANGTKTINQAVSRHKDRFPNDFYFQLTITEYKNLWSQFGTAKSKMVRSIPYAFTEQGVAMLATVLRTEVAAKVSINIMRAFVAMHKYISNNLIEQRYMQNMLLKHDNDIKLLQESFKKFEEKKIINEIYFSGQIYDAYSKIIDILKTAQKTIIVIDGYCDKTTLDIIKNTNVKTFLITKRKTNLKTIDINKYNKQYHNLKIIYNETFHDRYIIIDKNIVYHCGASINYAGSRTFSINILEDNIVKHDLIDNITKLINK